MMQLGCHWCRSGLVVSISILGLSACVSQDTQDLQRYIDQVKRTAQGQPLEPLPEIEPYRPYPYEAGVLRDPFAYARFVVDAMTRREQPQQIDPLMTTGILPDFDRPREQLESYSLEGLRMVGTFRDFATDDLWALIKAPDDVVHRVREGNFIGRNYGEIYAVSEQSIEIIEIVQDQGGNWREREQRCVLTMLCGSPSEQAGG